MYRYNCLQPTQYETGLDHTHSEIEQTRLINFHGVSDKATLHITGFLDLTYFSSSQRSKFVKKEKCLAKNAIETISRHLDALF
jgi:hypothetical protein